MTPLRQQMIDAMQLRGFSLRNAWPAFWSAKGCWSGMASIGYLAADPAQEGPMDQLLGHSITYRIAVGPQQGRAG